MKFLQFSDLHLDSSLAGGKLGMPGDKASILESELKTSIRTICRIAQEENVHCMLIPGDLFNDEDLSLDTTLYLIEQFSIISTIPVIIAPGNHDFYSPLSFYNSDFLATRGFPSWPENVMIFSSSEFQTFPLMNRDDVTVTGRAFVRNVVLQERLLQRPISKDKSKIDLLIFHGSLDDYTHYFPQEKGKMVTAPFSREELILQGFHYATIGHYHSHYEIRDQEGRIIGAYAGCPIGRNLREYGEKSIIIGEINDQGVVSLKKRKISNRQIRRVVLNITGLKHLGAMKEFIGEEIKKLVKDPKKIVYVELHGVSSCEISVDVEEEILSSLNNHYFHLKINVADVKPDYGIGAYVSGKVDTTLVEAQYVRKLWQEIQQSEGEERVILEQALYYGLDALKQKNVEPRYED